MIAHSLTERTVIARATIAVLSFGVFVCMTAATLAGPVKHWAELPGREIRAIALRGGLDGEPTFAVVQGRDGYVYLRGRFGLYRLLDDAGNVALAADTGPCSGYFESDGADTRTSVPLAICSRASEIIVAGATRHVHIRTPVPRWRSNRTMLGMYNVPPSVSFLTAVIPAATGGYWFSYGYAQGLGRVDADGHAVLHRFERFDLITSIVASGEGLYVADNRCRVALIRDWRIVAMRNFGCGSGDGRAGLVAAPDGSVWVFFGETLERWGARGPTKRWRLSSRPFALAVAKNGDVYALCKPKEIGQFGTSLAIISGSRVTIRKLPTEYAENIFVDGRDRIWITVPFWHAAAVVSGPL